MSRDLEMSRADRRQERSRQLLLVAVDLFRRYGYHQVGMADIAAGAGLSGPAVYRYFPSKQAMLSRAVWSISDAYEAEETLRRPGDSFWDRIGRMTRVAVTERDAMALWQRDYRYLPLGEQQRVRQRIEQSLLYWATELRQHRPELTADQAGLLAWAGNAVLGSAALYRVRLPRERYVEIVAAAAQRVLAAEFPSPAEPGAPLPASTGVVGRPRWEVAMAEAARLFCERGYHAVSMEDIGAAAGVTAAALYKYTEGKSELLSIMFQRASEHLHRSVAAALEGVDDPLTTLSYLAETRVRAIREHPHLLAVYITESENLPARELGMLRRRQRDYAIRWARSVMALRPGLTEADARVLAHCAVSIIDSFACTPSLHARQDVTADIVHFALCAMGVLPKP